MINEFGETIKEATIDLITERIQQLSYKKIDLLWFGCGWIDSDKSKRNTALPMEKIKKIKKNKKLAIKFVAALLNETPKNEVLKHLLKLENI